MKRLRGAWGMLAVTLAVLMPLELTHGLWMACPTTPATSHATACGSSDHDCCTPSATTPPAHDAVPSGCSCIELPAATLPVAAVPAQVPTLQAFAILAVADLFAAAPAAPAPIPAFDVGRPKLPIVVDAHGLRAPPLSA